MLIPQINERLIYKRLGRSDWGLPEYMGGTKWGFRNKHGDGSVILSVFPDSLGIYWVHASITRKERMPSYEDLKLLHRAVFGDLSWSYQVFAPASQHVNIHEYALHLWGRADGSPALPDFAGLFESITGVKSV
jgi:hypothetical protein